MRTVRLATEADAAGILAVYAPYIRDTAVTFETETPSLDAFRCRMASIIGDYPYLVVEEDGSIVGFAYAHRLGERAAYAWNAELSIYFAPGCTSRGWGSVLFWALIDLLALQGVRNAYSLITVPNEASLALHEKLGFTLMGVQARRLARCGVAAHGHRRLLGGPRAPHAAFRHGSRPGGRGARCGRGRSGAPQLRGRLT